MLTELDEERIITEFFDTWWFDSENRPKTMKAVFRIMERIPPDEREILFDRISFIFAPKPSSMGFVCPAKAVNDRDEERIMVYLAPQLERLSQKYVDQTVAHEFAHVMLGHPIKNRSLSNEREADNKIRAWGLSPAYKPEQYPDS